MGTSLKHDAKTIDRAIERVAVAIVTRHAKTEHLLLLGIANGGVALASRLARQLRRSGLKPGLGTIDISFHRDDIGDRPITKESLPTLIPHEVNGAAVILVDDVLHSGRTTKAALNELFDHGRPSEVELAVLVDRGDRRLPISANYAGFSLTVKVGHDVVVTLDPEYSPSDSVVVISTSVNHKSKNHSRALAS